MNYSRSTRKIEDLIIGTLNCRGIQKDSGKTILADDLDQYQLDVVALQETHIKHTGLEIIQVLVR